MWLDEALTVDIARLPLDQIPHALSHDGHPPLYYFLLHGWMAVFGESDRAIRALPGVFGVAAIPATWLLARRVGGRHLAWCTAVVLALLPFAVRYSTENRMYSLLMLLVPLGWLCADSALRRPRPVPLVGLALCTSALLWSQYWSMWLGLGAGVIVTWRLIRDLRRADRSGARASGWVLGALGVGVLSFIPWVPTLLYQQAHTGTPWASRAMPPTVAVNTVQGLGGGLNATDEVAGWLIALCMIVGLFGVGIASGRIELDLRTRRWIRPVAWPAALTLLFGVTVMLATNSAFQPRYNSVWLPFAFVLAGAGLAVLQGPWLQRAALAAVVVACLPGVYQNVTTSRTQATQIADGLARSAKPGDVVMVCPDQLGPSLVRVVRSDLDIGTFPAFGDPAFVDWVDYVERSRAIPPDVIARRLVQRAGPDRRIFVVWSTTYTTHKKLCTDLVTSLSGLRPDNTQLIEASRSFYESATLTEFRPGTGP